MGTVTGGVTLREGTLAVSSLRSEAPWGTASATGHIRLWGERIDAPDPLLPFTVSSAKIDNLQLRNLLPSIGMSARVSVNADRITGQAARLMDTVEGVGTVSATEVRLGPDRASLVTAKLVANARMLKAEDIRITLDSEDVLEGSVMMTKGGRQLSAQLKSDALPLTAIKWFASQGIPLDGRVSADLSVDGTLSKPMLIGTISATDFALEPIRLGDGTFSITTTEAGQVELSALQNFPGINLLPGSYFTLERGVPNFALFKAEAVNAEVYDILPFLHVPDTELTASGLVEVTLWPGRAKDSWQVVMDAMPNDIKFSLFDGEMAYQNLSEFFMVQRAQWYGDPTHEPGTKPG